MLTLALMALSALIGFVAGIVFGKKLRTDAGDILKDIGTKVKGK